MRKSVKLKSYIGIAGGLVEFQLFKLFKCDCIFQVVDRTTLRFHPSFHPLIHEKGHEDFIPMNRVAECKMCQEERVDPSVKNIFTFFGILPSAAVRLYYEE